MTPMLHPLHGLCDKFRVHFKILPLTYRAPHSQAPAYISELLHPHITSGSLRSSDQGLLVVPRTRLKTEGEFEAVAPALRNHLPKDLRDDISVDASTKQLKTHLYKFSYVSPSIAPSSAII